jgi:hypothetical protein
MRVMGEPVDLHARCVDSEFCLFPEVKPGPCAGPSSKSGGGGGKKKAAKKAKKAPVAKKATAQQQRDAKSTAAAAAMAGLAPGVDGAAFGESLRRGLAGAVTADDRNAIITEHALQLARVLANTHASGASPGGRRRLTELLAIRINDGIRGGDADPLKELVGKFDGGLDDGDIIALTRGRSSVRAAAKGDDMPKAKRVKTWSGVLAPIGKPTGDGRMFAPGSLSSRDFPLPLSFQRSDTGGHSGKIVVARILGIEYRDGEAYGHGDWLDPKFTPEVLEAQELTRAGVIGPSVDLDATVLEMVPAEPEGEQAASDCGCDGEELAAEDAPMIKLITKGRISGATLVQIPAFAECAALTLGSDDPDLPAFAPGEPVTLAADGDTAFYVGDDGETATVVRDNGRTESVPLAELSAAPEDAQAWADALVASSSTDDGTGWLVAAALAGPPASWFDDPKLTGPTALQIDEHGRVFGHMARWNTCHVGLPGCVTAPSSPSNYAYFHTGEIVSAEGRRVGVGRITLGTGHADADSGFRAAAEHYDDTGTCVATVRAGQDAYGIWVAGALVPECDERRRAELQRSVLSGDWRRIGGELELVAALAVNSGGFPVPRAMVADGRTLSLVASGVVTARSAGPARVDDRDVDAAVERALARRETFQSLDGIFDQAEVDLTQQRVEVAAAYLAVLD